MDRHNLINQIVEELNVGAELGYEYERIAENILALVEGSREHLDYDSKQGRYIWDE